MRLALSLVLLLVGCQTGNAVSDVAVADGECGTALSCADAGLLATTVIPVVAPTYLPDGAEVVGVTLATADLAEYGIHYRAGAACFTIEGAAGLGVGGAWPENETAAFEADGFTPTYGEARTVVWWNGPEVDPDGSAGPDVLWSDFVSPHGHPEVGYRLMSAAGDRGMGPDSYRQPADCQMLDPEEARRIVSSLEIMEGTRDARSGG